MSVNADIEPGTIDADGLAGFVAGRYSCRSYLERAIEPADRRALERVLAGLTRGPLGSSARFALLAADENDRRSLKGLGTYGNIKNAAGFLVGAVESSFRDMEDYGYLMEKAVLAATGIGLGTCWLGGLFTRSAFGRRMQLKSGEVIPAIVATGYAVTRSPDKDRIRQAAGSDRRLPSDQLFFDQSLVRPIDLAVAGPYAAALEAVRRGPSASNKQPWRVIRRNGAWDFYLHRTKGYGKGTLVFSVFRIADLQRVDMGIAMSHFELTLRASGLNGTWVLEPPDTRPVVDDLEYVASWVTGRADQDG